MYITHLRVRDLRCLADVELQPHARLNLVLGPNGAGKSSLLLSVAGLLPPASGQLRFKGEEIVCPATPPPTADD